jgi:PAS domain S-box-containing protein
LRIEPMIARMNLRPSNNSSDLTVPHSSALPNTDRSLELLAAIREPAVPREADELRATKDLLESIVNASPMAIIATDLAGRVTMWNHAATQMFGWTAEEVLGQELPFHEEELRTIEELRQRALTGEVVRDIEVLRARKDGTIVQANLSVASRHDGEGRVIGTLGILADIDGRKAAETALRESEDKYRTLVEQIPAVTYVDRADPLGRPVYVSPQVESLLGISRVKWFKAQSLDAWLDLVHPDDREHARAASVRCAETGEQVDVEYRVQTPDGRLRWFHEVARLIPGEGRRCDLIHGVMLDITDLKHAEQERERSLARLQEALEDRRKLLVALVSAEEEGRRKIAGGIHDDSVQAMTVVVLRLGLLRGRLTVEKDLEVVDELERTARDAITRLRRLIFELHPPELDRDGLGAALRSALEQLKSAFGIDFGLDSRLEGEPEPNCRAIAYRIAQEAIANVRKHACGTRVDVVLQQKGEGVLVRITDDGVGFDVNAVAQQLPGHLGVIAMKERAEVAGGWLQVTSKIGIGSVVAFWIPFHPKLHLEAAREKA